MKILVRIVLRSAALIGCGWLVDRYFHTGWAVGILVVSVFERETNEIASDWIKG